MQAHRNRRRALRWAGSSLAAAALVVGALYETSLADSPLGGARERRSTPALTEVTLNGQRFMTLSGQTERTLGEVLASFERRCRPGGGLFEWASALDRPGPIAPRGRLGYPVTRAEDGEHGFVACLHLGRLAPEDPEGLLDEIARTGVLPAGVQSQYLYAHRASAGTTFALSWNPGELRIGPFAASERDAPGFDLEGVPRPPAGRRLMAGQASGRPQRIASYESRGQEAGALKTAYARILRARGWKTYDLGARVLAARRGERSVWGLFEESAPGRGVTTTLLAAGGAAR